MRFIIYIHILLLQQQQSGELILEEKKRKKKKEMETSDLALSSGGLFFIESVFVLVFKIWRFIF